MNSPDPIARLNAALEGRYRIERELGEGGMATVYLADDLKHGRKVALKVLKPELAAVVGAERFLAEIKTTANLQHPHILPLHDSGEADGFLYYVTPYIEGENLRDRINRERQLPVDDAVDIARKVAGALQAAHDQGVIHRDIKPANILLARGEPLVADFGIALAVSAAGGGRMTETGLSLGTPYYMSPEQAAGEETITGATDTFSLGCVLYEMLSGEPPFTGSSAQAVLGKILSTESVSVRQARSATPPNVDAAIRRCLERLPADRFSSIGAVATALANPAFRHGAPERSELAAAPVNRVLVVTTVALAAALGWSLLRPPGEGRSTPAPLRTYSLAVEPGRDPTTGFDISDDGRLLTYVGLADTEGVELFVRELGDLQLRRLRGSAPGGTPAISPDGEEIVYFGGGELRIVSVAGGEPRRLTDAILDRPDWGPDGSIYFVGPEQGIARIGREGGVPEVLVHPDPGAVLRTPHLIAGTDILLYTRLQRGVAPEIRSQNLSTGEARTVLVGMSPTVTSSGHLLFGGREGLMAAPFDLDRLEVVGDAVLVIPEVTSSPLPYYQVSDNGLLVYWSGTFSDEEFVWVDRLGAARPVERGWSFNAGNANQGWDLSPDGRSIVFRALSDGGYDLWIKEVDGGPPSRLTFDPAPDERPHWSPDGAVVTFVSSREEGRAAWQIRADGTGEPELIAALEAGTSTAFWAPGDDRLVLRTDGMRNTRGGRDILLLRPGSDEPPSVIAAGSGDETGPVVSDDGRWIAYVSDETGRFEVFVRPFPDASGGRWQVTSAGGTMPLWAHNGRELFYVDLEHRVVQVSFDTARGFRVTGERVLFPLDGTYVTATYRWTAGLWDITPGDERFLMVRRRQRPWEERAQLIVIENFFEELQRRVPRR